MVTNLPQDIFYGTDGRVRADHFNRCLFGGLLLVRVEQELPDLPRA